ncbi:hypothetical protein ACWDWV_08420 [Streptosporangium sandarakinum]
MHGIYRRPLTSDTHEVTAYWHGYLLWRWQEVAPIPAIAAHDLLSPWNLILSEGLSMQPEAMPYGADLDGYTSAWRSWALLARQLPYATFSLPAADVLTWRIAAGRAGLAYDREPDPQHEGYERVVAARQDTYGTLFDLDAICAAYRSALPGHIAQESITALMEHRDIPVSAYATRELLLQHAPTAVQGLTLGHPVGMTLIQLRRDTATPRHAPAAVPQCRHSDPHQRIAGLEGAAAQALVEFTQTYYSSEFLPQGRPNGLEDLVGRPYLIGTTYWRYLAMQGPRQPVISGELYGLICCLLRGPDCRGDELAPERMWAEYQINRAYLASIAPDERR